MNTDPPPGWSSTVEGSATWLNGNTRQFLGSANGMVNYYRRGHLGFARAQADYGSLADVATVARVFGHLRYRFPIRPFVDAEVFAQHANDHFRRLEYRELAGVGPRFHIVEVRAIRFIAALHFMLEYERLAHTAIPNSVGYWPDSGLARFDQRWSGYATVASRLGSKMKVAETIYFQPKATDFTNIRALSELEFVATVTKMVAIRLSVTSVYDSNPPDGVYPIDSTLKTSIQLNFK